MKILQKVRGKLMKKEEDLKKIIEKLDSDFVFYYDETNNIRKLYLSEEKLLNIDINHLDKNFALGGVVCPKGSLKIDFNTLKNNLRLQENVKEIKFKHIGKKGHNNFLEILDLKNINIFLQWLNDQDLYIHYTSLNLLYWSIIDILEFEYDNLSQEKHSEIKTVLYLCAKLNLDRFLNILKKHNYPNVNKTNRAVFVYDIKRFLQKNKNAFKDTYSSLKYTMGITYKSIDLIIALLDRNITSLEFIVDNDILIENMLSFYYTRMTSTFKNSIHAFDEELILQKQLNTMINNDNETNWERICFIDSEDDVMIQISDVVIGLLGKTFEFINNSSYESIKDIKKQLNERQLSNLFLMSILLHKSNEKNKYFLHSVEGLNEHKKFWMLFDK